MGFILLLVVIGIIAWALSWQPYDDRAPTEPAEAAAPPQAGNLDPSRGTAERVSQSSLDQWTALDEHQLNRLLNETT